MHCVLVCGQERGSLKDDRILLKRLFLLLFSPIVVNGCDFSLLVFVPSQVIAVVVILLSSNV